MRRWRRGAATVVRESAETRSDDVDCALPDGLAERATLIWAWPSIAATIDRLTSGARTG